MMCLPRSATHGSTPLLRCAYPRPTGAPYLPPSSELHYLVPHFPLPKVPSTAIRFGHDFDFPSLSGTRLAAESEHKITHLCPTSSPHPNAHTRASVSAKDRSSTRQPHPKPCSPSPLTHL
jgi:hypothetical protein